MNKNDINFECDMLKGNINRLFLSDDIDELQSMFSWADKRLKLIYEYNLKRLNDKTNS